MNRVVYIIKEIALQAFLYQQFWWVLFIILMSKREDIIAFVDKMDISELHMMKDEEKNDLLTSLKLAIRQEKNCKKGCEKNKQIIKLRKQVNYKKYVRDSMRGIMMKLSTRLFRFSKAKGNISGEIEFKQRFYDSLKRKKDNFRKNVKKIIGQTKADELCCSICLQLMISPVMIACGHAFCYQCLDESLIFSRVCPNCRDTIKIPQIIRAGLLDKIIRAKAIAQPNTGEVHYSTRLTRHEQWKKGREVDLKSLRAGFLLDVRDTQNIWCQGTVLDVIYQQPNSELPNAILIHFNKWNKIYNEVIQVPSLRVAPVQFFSTRRDIPFYRLAEQDDNMRGLVVPNRLDNILQNNLFDSESQDELIAEEGSESSSIREGENVEHIAPIQELFNMNLHIPQNPFDLYPPFQFRPLPMPQHRLRNMLQDIIGRAQAEPLFRYNGQRIEDATRRIADIMELDNSQPSNVDDLEGYEEDLQQQ